MSKSAGGLPKAHLNTVQDTAQAIAEADKGEPAFGVLTVRFPCIWRLWRFLVAFLSYKLALLGRKLAGVGT